MRPHTAAPRAFLLALLALVAPLRAQEPAPQYAAATERLATFIEAERADKGLPAVFVVLVDDQRTVWARGFGTADPATDAPAAADSLVRVGSVSKLFTDLALMQLVAEGKVDLDAPVSTYLPGFAPKNPHDEQAITLRHLMSHRAGLVREPPVGHYFDLAGPSLAETVESVAGTTLIHPPGARTKYSNAGLAVVGRVVETLRGKPFAGAVRESVLAPMAMDDSGFTITDAQRARLARGIMWTDDGRTSPAPPFALGMIAAGDLHSTPADLGRFLAMLHAGGQGGRGRVLSEALLHSMWVPQFVPEGSKSGFGLGFVVDEFEGTRRVGHSGAVYGFATALSDLPDEKLGAAVIITRDCFNATAQRIADEALRQMRAVRVGQPAPEIASTRPLDRERARSAAGRYSDADGAVDLIERNGRLFLLADRGGTLREVRAFDDGRLVLDGPHEFGTPVGLDGEVLTIGRRTLRHADPLPAMTVDPAWRELIGEYGWDHNTLYILERDGNLNAQIEWFFLYPLTALAGETSWRFPDYGMYDNEELTFLRDERGQVTGLRAAGVVFPRRPLPGEDGTPFRIAPAMPIEEARAAALAAEPPAEPGPHREPDLVDLAALDPTIHLDIRYATPDNFLGTPVYPVARARLQRPAAEALVRAHRALEAEGYGLLVHDAYRPWSVTKLFRLATPAAFHGFVADPDKGSRHNRGCAVDLTLYDRATGAAVEMPGGYDEFSARSAPDYPGGTTRQRRARDTLRRAMEAQGFTVNELEWWHFDFDGWDRYPIGNTPLDAP